MRLTLVLSDRAPTGRGVALAVDDVVPATWLPDAAVAALRESI
jgi:hypothetical protein